MYVRIFYYILLVVNSLFCAFPVFTFLHYILDIFLELQICGVEEISPDRFRFYICYRAEKANIEKSSILKRLRTQCRSKS